MGWSPHYPGWFDVAYYVENSDEGSAPNGAHTENRYIPKLLSFAENIAKYPIAVKTKWFSDLLCCLEKYKIENGIYAFPKKWLTEKKGYAVGGHHLSFGREGDFRYFGILSFYRGLSAPLVRQKAHDRDLRGIAEETETAICFLIRGRVAGQRQHFQEFQLLG